MRVFKTLLMAILLIGMTTSAMAIPLWFDADGAGAGSAVLIDKFAGITTAQYDVTTLLGADGALGNGDTFTESFTLGLDKGFLNNSQAAAFPQFGAPGFEYSLYATLANLQGAVSAYSSATAPPTTATNPLAIADDTFKINFTAGVGTIGIYFDSSDDDTYNGTLLGSFAVLQGNSDPYIAQNGTLTSKVGLDLVATSLTSGVWFLDNGGVKGADISTLAPNVILIALADGSNNLVGFAGDVKTADPTDDILKITVADNGTTVQFAAVPEPATMLLLGVGLLGVAAIRRKRA